MTSRLVLWPSLAGIVFLVVGLISARKRLSFNPDKLIAVGPVFVASALAAFGTEHLVASRSIMQIVPSWIPGHLFWTYFIGIALLAGVASLVNRRARLAATWLAIAVTLSVLLLYIPLMALAPTIEALNYVADTLLFAGTTWLLAQTSQDFR